MLRLSSYWCLITILFSMLLFATTSVADTRITFRGRHLGTVEELKIVGDSEDSTRLMISTVAHLDSLLHMLDEEMADRGSLVGGCSARLYWREGTRIRWGGEKLGLKSRVRYRKRICAVIKTPWVSISTDVDWELKIVQGNGLGDIWLAARVTNVRNLPPWLEEVLDLRVSSDLKIPFPVKCGRCTCAKVAQDLDLEMESVSFGYENGMLKVVVQWSARGDRLSMLLGCF